MLYTIIPLEIVFKGTEEGAKIKEREIINYNGVVMEAIRQSDGRYRIERLLSTDPMLYLDEHFQPGSIITLV
ncbi:hypothetical protein Mahau_0944 [Mahella australiensis 50-1 BON]|uniref:YlzJ-like protein n=2 Tax=Mahella TaxID=252965 RepID=F4A295_MAHA5|nr:hypothetical protein Mahau_0944 [Mahella australiensis 50-1 BON]